MARIVKQTCFIINREQTTTKELNSLHDDWHGAVFIFYGPRMLGDKFLPEQQVKLIEGQIAFSIVKKGYTEIVRIRFPQAKEIILYWDESK